MTNNFNKIIIGLCAVLLASCGLENDPLKDAYGYLQLNFKEDLLVDVNGTKADDPTFAVSILNSDNVVVKKVNDHRELISSPLKLKAGTYYINATSGENVECGFEKPFYNGDDTVSLAAGKVSSSEVVCTLANMMVSIELDNSVTENFKECIVTVKNPKKGTTLIFSSQNNTLDKKGYFAYTGDNLTWSLYLVNNNGVISNNEVSGVIENVKPKEHYVLNFRVSQEDQGGATNVTVTLDDSLNEKEQNFIINLNKMQKPVFSTSGFNLEAQQFISIGSTLAWKVNVIAKAGLQKLLVKHSNLAFSNAGIPSSFNVINTPDKAAINSAGLTWENAEASSELATLDFSNLISKLPLGDYEFAISALDNQQQLSETTFKFKVIPSVETSTVSVEQWAKRAYFFGVWNTETKPSGLGFEYKKVSEQTWTKITSGFDITGNAYSCMVSNLEPATDYVFRTFSDKEASNEISFTTERADQIYNMTFDNWYQNGGTYIPNASADNKWWDSSNAGANIAGSVNPTSPSSDFVAVSGTGKNAAKLESKSVFGVLAAGSIYLGDFGRTIGTSGAELYFGRPYTCRPLALKGYYSYAPATINKSKDPYKSLSGQNDFCQIYIVLGDWGKQCTVNTSEKVFIDFANDPNIIAYGEISDNTNTNGYKPFTINLEYRSKRIPTHCVIVCSSSKYGDYFTGGVGSILYVDEFEFVF